MKTILFNLRLFCALTFCNDENLRSTNKITDLLAIGSRSFGSQLLMLVGEPPPQKWSALMIRKLEDHRWRLRDPNPKRSP